MTNGVWPHHGTTPNLRVVNRILAHGDEFNAIAITPDEKLLFIGTEGGEVLVWDIAAAKISRRLQQGSPVHALAFLDSGRLLVAAGGPHTAAAHSPVIRLWDVGSGTSTSVPATGKDSLFLLAVHGPSGRFVTADFSGRITVWAKDNTAPLAAWDLGGAPLGLALGGNSVYVTTASFEETADADKPPANQILTLSLDRPAKPVVPLRADLPPGIWLRLALSPGEHFLSAHFLDANERSKLLILDLATGRQYCSSSPAASSAVWLAPDLAMLFSEDTPVSLLHVSAGEAFAEEKFPAWSGFHSSGMPSGPLSWTVSADGGRAWGVFSQLAGLAAWEVRSKERPQLLQMTPSLVYAFDVRTREDGSGLLATGGDDGFVRIRDLSFLSLLHVFRVPRGVPQGIALLADGRRAVISYGLAKTPTDIVVADFASGKLSPLLTLEDAAVSVIAIGNNFLFPAGRSVRLASPETAKPVREFSTGEPVHQLAASAGGEWLTVAGQNGSLYLFEMSTGRLVRRSSSPIKDLTCLAVTRDGRYVYTSDFSANLRRWDTRDDSTTALGSHRGQCAAFSLSSDERFLLLGGNHRDVMLFNAQTGKQVFYTSTPDADFNVTHVWLDGSRLIFTTDTGVLVDGRLPQK